MPSSPWQGAPALALLEAGKTAQHPQWAHSLPHVLVCALYSYLGSHLSSRRTASLTWTPGYTGQGNGRDRKLRKQGPARAGGHRYHSAPQSGTHASSSFPPGQPYEVPMLYNPKLGDTAPCLQLLNVGNPLPRTGKGWVCLSRQEASAITVMLLSGTSLESII